MQVKTKVPKGWIILDVLCENEELTEEQKAELEIQKLIKGNDDIDDIKWNKENTIFKKTLIQVSNITAIDLEYGPKTLIKGKSYVHLNGVCTEVKQHPLEIVTQIEYDRYGKPDQSSIPTIKE